MDGSKCCIALRLPFVMVFPSQQPGMIQIGSFWHDRPMTFEETCLHIISSFFLFQAGSPFTRYTCQLLGSNGQGLYHTFETHPMITQGGRLVRALWRNKRIESSCDLMLNIWCLNRPQWTRWDSQAIMISVNWSFTGPDLWWYAFGSLLLEGLSFCFRFELRWKCP